MGCRTLRSSVQAVEESGVYPEQSEGQAPFFAKLLQQRERVHHRDAGYECHNL